MTKGISDLQPARLEQALAARGLTKGQLASLVGVAASTVTKWCKGDQSPEAETFERLASILNLQSEWLTRPMLQRVSRPLFRSNASALKLARAKLEAHTEWVQEATVLLSEYVAYPELSLPDRDFTDPEQIRHEDIEAAAEECRVLWELGKGPIQNLTLASESAGIIVTKQETETPVIEGLSTWSALLRRPIIFLSADKANAFRSRFDLAHEIGHLILHKHIPRSEERERYNQMEVQAHRFASALLLPSETFSNEVRLPTTLDSLLTLKQRWGVSVAAMVMRLHALGLLSDDEKLALFKRRSARWGSKSEPGDGNWEKEEPRLLRRTLELLISEGILAAEDIPRYLGTSPGDIEKLCQLRHNFFSNPSEVIELATLRTMSKTNCFAESAIPSDNKASVLPFKKRMRQFGS